MEGPGNTQAPKAGQEDANRTPSAPKWSSKPPPETPREEAGAPSEDAKSAPRGITAEKSEKYTFGSPRRTLGLGKSRQTARDIFKNPLPCPDVNLGTQKKPGPLQKRRQDHQS